MSRGPKCAICEYIYQILRCDRAGCPTKTCIIIIIITLPSWWACKLEANDCICHVCHKKFPSNSNMSFCFGTLVNKSWLISRWGWQFGECSPHLQFRDQSYVHNCLFPPKKKKTELFNHPRNSAVWKECGVFMAFLFLFYGYRKHGVWIFTVTVTTCEAVSGFEHWW